MTSSITQSYSSASLPSHAFASPSDSKTTWMPTVSSSPRPASYICSQNPDGSLVCLSHPMSSCDHNPSTRSSSSYSRNPLISERIGTQIDSPLEKVHIAYRTAASKAYPFLPIEHFDDKKTSLSRKAFFFLVHSDSHTSTNSLCPRLQFSNKPEDSYVDGEEEDVPVRETFEVTCPRHELLCPMGPSFSSSSSSNSSNPPLDQPKKVAHLEFPLKNVHKVYGGVAAISSTTPLVVSSFPPFYVVAGYHPIKAIVFLAHIDPHTIIRSLSDRLHFLNIRAGGSMKRNILGEFQWYLAAKWNDYPASREKGGEILRILQQNHIPSSRIDLSKYTKKSASDDADTEEAFFGYISPKDGQLKGLTKPGKSFEMLNELRVIARIDDAVNRHFLQHEVITCRELRDQVAPHFRLPLTLDNVS